MSQAAIKQWIRKDKQQAKVKAAKDEKVYAEPVKQEKDNG